MSGKDLKKIKENPELWKRDILPLFYRYIKYGMFPELVGEEDEEYARKYVLNNIIERVVYRDLPEEFGIRDVEILKNLIYLLGKNPGMIANYNAISRDFKRDQRTIASYFEYLEYGLLLKLIYNYRGSPLASMRKLKKACFSTPNIAFALNPSLEKVLPQMLENAVLTETDAIFFRNNFEIDFLLVENDKLTAIEVKKTGKEVKQIKKFKEKFEGRIKKAIIVDLEEEGKVDDVEIVPAWKYMLILQAT